MKNIKEIKDVYSRLAELSEKREILKLEDKGDVEQELRDLDTEMMFLRNMLRELLNNPSTDDQ
jgi:hypothetical protein